MQESPKKGKDFWGSSLWRTIHTFGATFKPENAEKFKMWLELTADLMPCDYCGRNLHKKLRNYPPEPYLTNNDDAFFYSYVLHDLVNQHITEKHPENPKVSPPYDDVKTFYFRALGEKCKDCQV